MIRTLTKNAGIFIILFLINLTFETFKYFDAQNKSLSPRIWNFFLMFPLQPQGKIKRHRIKMDLKNRCAFFLFVILRKKKIITG